MTDLLTRVLELFEELDGDENDIGPYGMDSMSRKRLKVGKMMQKRKVKPRRPMRTKLPYSMANIPKLPAGESKLRGRGYLPEGKGAPRFKKGMFEIETQDPSKRYVIGARNQTIKQKQTGYILGHVGIHKHGAMWPVSHIPTGKGAGGYFEKLSLAKLYAEMVNALVPNSDDEDRVMGIAGRHAGEFKEYEQYLGSGGRKRYHQWKEGGR